MYYSAVLYNINTTSAVIGLWNYFHHC